jgi:hypothetical protein
MIVYVKFIAVSGRGTIEDIKSYLYDHTTVLSHYSDDNTVYAVLRTETPDSDERAQYLADYQAARLGSGLQFRAKVADQIQEVYPIGDNEKVWA